MRFAPIAAAAILAVVSGAASAATIEGPTQIIASTDVPVCEAICAGFGANIAEIADGDSSNFNGFAGRTGVTGTITLDLIGTFDLESFTLFNDLNVLAEGVETFQLRFFDAADALISTSAVFNAPVGQVAGETYEFAGEVLGVSKVELDVLSLLNNSRIEIREVLFNGEEVAPIPLPAGLPLLGAGLLALGLVRRKRG